jgi:hypothetical protein
MPNESMKIVVLSNIYLAGGRRQVAGGGSGTESTASTPTKTQYFLCEAEVQLIILRQDRVLRAAECRLLKGVFVPKMSGINSGQNVYFGSFVGHMVIRYLLGLHLQQL